MSPETKESLCCVSGLTLGAAFLLAVLPPVIDGGCKVAAKVGTAIQNSATWVGKTIDQRSFDHD